MEMVGPDRVEHSRKHWLLALAAVNLALVPITASAARPPAPAVVNVSNSANLAEGEETVSANPRNPRDLLVGSNQWQPATPGNAGNVGVGASGTTSCAVFDSHDGGGTWKGRRLGTAGFGEVSLPLPVPGSFHEFSDLGNLISADQNTVWDNHGNVYYQCIYAGLHRSTPQVWVFRSQDQGRTWSDPVVAFDEVSTGVQIDRSFLAVDNSGGARDGTLYLTFETMFYQPAPAAVYVRSSDRNDWTNWGPPGVSRRVDDPAQEAQWDPRQFPQVSPDGTLRVVYDAAPPTVSPCPCGPDTPALIMASSTDGGNTFSHSVIDPRVKRIQSQDEAFNFFQEFIAAFAVDPTNAARAAVAWPDGASGEDRLLLRVTSDGGRTWSQRLQLADDPPGKGNQHDHPALSYLPDGTLVAVWRDRRFSDGKLGSPFDVFMRTGRAAASGLALGPSLRLTSSSQPTTTGHHGNMPSEYLGLWGDVTGAEVSWDQLDPAGLLTDNYFTHVSAAQLPPADTAAAIMPRLLPRTAATAVPMAPAAALLVLGLAVLLAARRLLAGLDPGGPDEGQRGH
ncbi:MAG: glycoside hydrolase [Candidatus Dormibacteraeota bacterium]|nr:glycoside hydrolase [Candidatus Dormibacteraeota bacterium]